MFWQFRGKIRARSRISKEPLSLFPQTGIARTVASENIRFVFPGILLVISTSLILRPEEDASSET